MHHESNGYAGNATRNTSSGQLNSVFNVDSTLGVIDTDHSSRIASWFHFLIKQLEERTPPNRFPKYDWYEMSFYIYSTNNITGDALLFCFDTPPHFQSQLIKLLKTTRSDPPKEPLAFLQSTVLGVVVEMYDTSVWRARDHIRKIEKVGVYQTVDH